jgi:hypothetical protein
VLAEILDTAILASKAKNTNHLPETHAMMHFLLGISGGSRLLEEFTKG